jgi:hypothetical protein
MSEPAKIMLTLMIVSIITLIFLLFIHFAEAEAHMKDKPELNSWFNGLASGKGNCCSFADGYVVEDVDWESKDGHYRVQIQNKAIPGNPMQWVDVPDDAVITEPNRAGPTMVWPIYGYLGMSIRCFLPGSMT